MFVFQRIAYYAQTSPDTIAVVCGGKEYSYEWLDKQVSIVASNLHKRGYKGGSVIGLSFDRSADYIVCILAIHKVGLAFLPLDASQPVKRLERIVKSSALEFIIYNSTPLPLDATSQVSVSELSQVNESDFSGSTDVTNNTLAYVIFTSGSTGTPKGVRISQGALSSLVDNMNDTVGIHHKDMLFSQADFNFDMSIADIFWPLSSGASIYLATHKELKNPRLIIQALSENRVSILQATASWFRFLFIAGWTHSNKYTILCGGEAFPSDIQSKLMNCSIALWNMYGPTEATVWVSAQKINSVYEKATIGIPFSGTCFDVVDKNLDGIGELLISGPQVAIGYIGASETDHSRFSFDSVSGFNTYRSGDLVRVDEGGEFICLGRSDRQVKIRGFRVELDEIETLISKINGVDKAAVLLHENSELGSQRLLAFIEVSHDLDGLEAIVSHVCANELPAYMRPDEIHKLPSIPINNNFKVDYLALNNIKEGLNKQASRSSSDFSDKLDALSLSIFELWRKHLGVTIDNPDSDFFELGGNSLCAVKIIAEIKHIHSIEIPLDSFLGNPGFESFCTMVKMALAEPLSSIQNKNTLVSLKKGALGVKPLYCVHGIGGGVLNYRYFADLIDDAVPLLALQAQGLDGISQPGASIEEMAASYIEEIKKHQPYGPYTLSGGSMGGGVAFEMACQLKAMNDEVAALFLFDSYEPDCYRQVERVSLFYKLRKVSKRLFSSEATHTKLQSIFLMVFSSLLLRVESIFLQVFVKLLRAFKRPIPYKFRYEYIRSEHMKALINYRPKKIFDGDLFFLKAGLGTGDGLVSGDVAWQRYISGKVHVKILNASHDSMMEHEDTADYVSKHLNELGS